jgi:hypothetical protein
MICYAGGATEPQRVPGQGNFLRLAQVHQLLRRPGAPQAESLEYWLQDLNTPEDGEVSCLVGKSLDRDNSWIFWASDFSWIFSISSPQFEAKKGSIFAKCSRGYSTIPILFEYSNILKIPVTYSEEFE